MRVQDLRDGVRERQSHFFNKRGWSDGGGFRWQLCFARRISGWFGFTVNLGGEDERGVQFTLQLLWWSAYLTWTRLLPARWAIGWYKRGEVKNPRWFQDSHGRSYGFYLYENHFVLKWGASNMGWSSDGSYGWSWSCFVDEKILGKKKYEELRPVEHQNVPIHFPEAVYHLNVKLTEDRWSYARWPWWPFTQVVPRAKIEVVEKGGIPEPGKGENSWDCGDDATFGLTCPAASLHEAVEQMRSTVNRTRRRHGGGEAMYVGRKVSPA